LSGTTHVEQKALINFYYFSDHKKTYPKTKVYKKFWVSCQMNLISIEPRETERRDRT